MKHYVLDVSSYDDMMRDLHPIPGTRLKQYVVDMRRDQAWTRATCPRVDVPAHDDNTGLRCRNRLSVIWDALDHDACGVCNDLMDVTRQREDVAAWRVERAARPAPCADRTAISDQVETWP